MMWRLLYIRPSAQSRVTRAISELAHLPGGEGLETYYPRERVWTGMGVRRRPVDRPLLPSMIFVHASDDHLDALMKVDGVYRRLDPHTTANALAIAGFIQELKVSEAEGGYDKTLSKKSRLEIGQRVKVLTGPYARFHATVVGLDRSGRAKLLTALFGREARITISPTSLELIDDETQDDGELAAA